MNLVINTDGAARGNPGPSSYGFVIKDAKSGAILHQEGKVLENGTNNVAEYTGVLAALEYVHKYYNAKAPHQIKVIADSLLIIQQLSGRFKVKHPRLQSLYQEIKALETMIGDVIYQHVYREQNFLADRLANKALDER